MYTLETDSFLLELDPEVHAGDLKYPINTILCVRVRSCGFSGTASMDLGVQELATFAQSLERLYSSLRGSARLEEPYGPGSFIEFTARTGGHIEINGILDLTAGGFRQKLCFENEIDQTNLKLFAERLLRDLNRYSVPCSPPSGTSARPRHDAP